MIRVPALMIGALLLSSLQSWGSDPPPIDMPTGPVAPVIPAPMPPTPVDIPLVVTPDVIYMWQADVDVVVTQSPLGLFTITKMEGPVKVRGRFADDPNKVQWKTFTKKYVFSAEPLKDGSGEIMSIPIGLKTEGDIVRRMVKSQTGAQPPPPVDPVKPTPVNPNLTKLQQDIKAALDADKTPKTTAYKYAACFRTAAPVMDAGLLKTTDDVYQYLNKTIKNAGIPTGTMNSTAKVVQPELNASFGPIKDLDKATVDKLKIELELIASSVEAAADAAK